MLAWRPLIASLSLLLALAPGWAVGGQPAKRRYINLTRFLVGFNLSAPAAGKATPREVELHASSDGGVTWNLVGKAKASEKGIEFHAPADGEYWFMPRTKFSAFESNVSRSSSGLVKTKFDGAIALAICLM